MRLLVIGNTDREIQEACAIARKKGAAVTLVSDIEQAVAFVREGKGVDLVMADVRQDIKGFLQSLKLEHITVPVVACGIKSDSDAAVRAIKAGAKEYIPLPPDPELIAAVLSAISTDNRDIIYGSPAMVKVISLADQIAPSAASVLITGPSGTGKEVIARYIHKKSKRKDKPFVSVNCAAIPENLLESELFGHEKGAFTGAIARRVGRFEESSGGTLLLDEISEMDLRLQAKLLRAIQEREIQRVGGAAPVSVDLRILATSNRDLKSAIKDGSFREDLYYRLNVIHIEMPALKSRLEDVLPLAEHFAEKYGELNGVGQKEFSDEAIALLRRYRWPGNVRELENTVHRAVLLARGRYIEPDALHFTDNEALTPENATATGSTAAARKAGSQDGEQEIQYLIGKTVAEVEQELVLQTLNRCLGNRTHAANILGISIRTLRNKLRQYQDAGVAVPPPMEGI